MRTFAVSIFLLSLFAAAAVPGPNWYERQTLTPQTQKRLHVQWKSCCEHGDVFRTRFRIKEDGSKYGVEAYQYWKDGRWNDIPPDIVQHEPTPNHEPILFLYPYHNDVMPFGTPVCFKIDEPGI